VVQDELRLGGAPDWARNIVLAPFAGMAYLMLLRWVLNDELPARAINLEIGRKAWVATPIVAAWFVASIMVTGAPIPLLHWLVLPPDVRDYRSEALLVRALDYVDLKFHCTSVCSEAGAKTRCACLASSAPSNSYRRTNERKSAMTDPHTTQVEKLEAELMRARLRIGELAAALTIAHKWMKPGVRGIAASGSLREMHERELRQIEAALKACEHRNE
jgi:hypothetical protein